jgi:hypothetical protein
MPPVCQFLHQRREPSDEEIRPHNLKDTKRPPLSPHGFITTVRRIP